MLLAIDVGNTNIVCGVFEADKLVVSWRLATLHERTADELWVLVSRLFAERGIDPRRIDGVVMASVVPTLTHAVSEMVTRELDLTVLNVDAGNAGLPIRYERPAEVGADRLVNGVAAWRLYGRPPRPIIVVDFGTATTFDALSADGTYQGGVICPGVEISADALFQRAARLPRVDVRKPEALIGRTTVGSIQSGIFFGYVAMVEGIVARLRAELAAGDDGACLCVATGGLAAAIAAETDVIDEVRGDLTLAGLRFVWERNEPRGRPPA